MLADHAQAVGGKLYIAGGGWSLTGPQPAPMAVVIEIEVPWDQANRKHKWVLELLDSDGHAFQVPTPTGEQPVKVEADFEVGRPPGLQAGTPLDVPIAINFGPLPLAQGRPICLAFEHRQ